MIGVACVWVRGNVGYGIEYVYKLRSMVARHLAAPHRFLVLTDQPGILAERGFEAVSVDGWPWRVPGGGPMPGWWAKLALFDRVVHARAFVGLEALLYLDLDSIVVGDLLPFLTLPAGEGEAIWACAPGGSFKPRGGLATVARLNSSVMAIRPHAPEVLAVWDRWDPGVAGRLWGDQDWIGEQIPIVRYWPIAWVPRISETERGAARPPGGARVVLCKKPKNDRAAEVWPWVREAWQ